VTGFEGDPSSLLRHEIAYVLGQMQDTSAIPFLSTVLQNRAEAPMVRHEAGEALGAIGSEESLPLLEEYSKDADIDVAETCILAVDRIKWKKTKAESEKIPGSPYASVDPAPRFVGDEDIEKLRAKLLDDSKSMFKRYRAMFTLRDIGGKEAVEALCDGFNDKSALFRHEVAYVLGQMQDPHSISGLKQVLERDDENPMVRHEAAEALGAIANDETTKILENYINDKHRVVRESCDVALDITDYYQGEDEFIYDVED